MFNIEDTIKKELTSFLPESEQIHKYFPERYLASDTVKVDLNGSCEYVSLSNGGARAIGLNFDLDGYHIQSREDYLRKILEYELDSSRSGLIESREQLHKLIYQI